MKAEQNILPASLQSEQKNNYIIYFIDQLC
jgi:hypothetical protein